MYQDMNMSVVFRSFDVFELLILPFHKGPSDLKFEIDAGILVI